MRCGDGGAAGAGFDLRGFDLDDLNDNILIGREEQHGGARPPTVVSAHDSDVPPPKGILRMRSRSQSWPPANDAMASTSSSTTTTTTTTLPQARAVRFLAPLVTAVRTRPRTHRLDVPVLHYSRADVRGFKREFRRKDRHRSSQSDDDEEEDVELCDLRDTELYDLRPRAAGRRHDNSYWRSKVGRRWGLPSSRRSSSTGANVDESEGDDAASPELLELIGTPSTGSLADPEVGVKAQEIAGRGVYSSVLLAVSLLNGPSSKYYSQENQHPATSCAVDTLYLF